MPRVTPLAAPCQVVYSSPDPVTIYPGSPGICRLDSGRLIMTYDLRGPGVADMPGVKCEQRQGAFTFGNVLTSDDGGRTWQHRTRFPFQHARPFVAGQSLYVLGHAGDLAVIRSDDGGTTWGEPSYLTTGQAWHQAPANVWYAGGCVYLVMERRCHFRARGWPVSELAPVLMRARIDDDLTQAASWTFASELSFVDAVTDRDLNYFGVPFYPATYPEPYRDIPKRSFAPIGWLETNVVQITDPDHLWYDPAGMTFHLFARAHTGRTNLACIAKVVQQEDDSMQTMLETAPSGRKMLYVPFPGGQMKFHILYDETDRLYWLVSTQATDSMTRPDRLAATRYLMADNERRRLALHFSKNCIDWCFAGLVDAGEGDLHSRHYASMAFDGDDLLVLSRSGDERAASPHDVNLVTLHCVRGFRDLVY